MVYDKKELIIETASDLFLDYGIQHLTMDDIASDCGISKKTIYKHFRNKADLISQIMDIKTSETSEELALITSTSENAVIEINRFFKLSEEILNSFSPTLLKEFTKNNMQIILKYSAFKKEILGPFMEQNIKRGQKEKLYKENLNTTEIRESSLNFLIMTIQEKASNNSISSNRMIEFLNSLLIYRLVTVKGLEVLKTSE